LPLDLLGLANVPFLHVRATHIRILAPVDRIALDVVCAGVLAVHTHVNLVLDAIVSAIVENMAPS